MMENQLIHTQSLMRFRRVQPMKLPRFFRPVRRTWLLYVPLINKRRVISLSVEYEVVMMATNGGVQH